MIDTNVLSESWHPIGNPLVKAALAAMTESSLFTSVIVIGELSKGVAKLSAGRRRDELIEWTGYIEKVFGDRVLPIDNAIAWRWGEITMRLSMRGRTLHAPDG